MRLPKQFSKFSVAALLAASFLLVAPSVAAQNRGAAGVADASADAEALNALQAFLFDASARAAFSNGNTNAGQANGFLEAFPADVQKELLEIVMMVMREKKENATVHVTAYKGAGVNGAMGSFSPAVKARIEALTKRLTQDKSFNNPQNMQKLKGKMPSFLAPNPG